MLRILIPVVMLLLGLGGGLGAGMFLAAPPEEEAASAEEETASETPEEEEDSGPDLANGLPVQPGSSEAFEYVRLNNQFIVPVVRDAAVRSLVVLSLTVEVEIGVNEEVFAREPRLRDAFLRVLFSHANAGGFDGSFTTPTALNPLRIALRDAAIDVLGPTVNDVLIVEIVRQDT